MRACIFTSSAHRAALVLLFATSVTGARAHAAPGAASAPGTSLPAEEDDFTPSPYTEYGEFNEESEEDEETRFLQNGRFFGLSVGLGTELIDGGRGQLYRGGIPLFDVRAHYWFDFNLALDLGFHAVKHYHPLPSTEGGQENVSLLQLGVNFRYYFSTRDLSAPLTFAGPFLLAGVGQMNKTQEEADGGKNKQSETSFMWDLGAGLEFPIKPRKAYFQLIGKVMFVNFDDVHTTKYQADGVNDLSGNFYSVTANVLFTW